MMLDVLLAFVCLVSMSLSATSITLKQGRCVVIRGVPRPKIQERERPRTCA